MTDVIAPTEQRVVYRQLTAKEAETVVNLENRFATLKELLDVTMKPSRELSLAQTKLEEAVMWAVRGALIVGREGLRED